MDVTHSSSTSYDDKPANSLNTRFENLRTRLVFTSDSLGTRLLGGIFENIINN